VCALSLTAPVTQRHATGWYHYEAGYRPCTCCTGLGGAHEAAGLGFLRRAHHALKPLQSPWLTDQQPARHAGKLTGRRQWPVRIYRSEVTPPAALMAPLVLQRWSAWEDLRRAGRDRRIPAGPGLYRIRRAGGETGLEYIGQTGRSLRGRLGQLGGVYHAQMPYRDPHTAAPALWALRHRDGCDFEAAVIEVSGTVPQRKALEAVAITLYRLDAGRSPAASFGRVPAGYRISSGNNARLAAAGRRYRGGPDPAALAGPASVPVNGLPGADPAAADWMGWAWSPWAPISRARRSAAGTGLYRVRSSCHAGLIYVGQGAIALRLRAHAAKALKADHRQGPGFSGDLEASWTALPGLALVSLLEHENDLIAAHVLAAGHSSAAQFLG
jgi:hypothetical protein